MRTPPYDISLFKERRNRLSHLLKDEAIIVAAPPEYPRNHDVGHNFRQDSNLFYLTGFEEPESVLVFRPGKQPETVLFVREKDPARETWDGFRYGPEAAQDLFGVDLCHGIDDFEAETVELLKDIKAIYYQRLNNPYFDRRIDRVLQGVRTKFGRSGKGILTVKDAYPLIGELRVRKTPFEVAEMQCAATISAEAHIALMKATHPGLNERALHGLFIKEIMQRGASREAYNSIVAGGANATTLHYVFNDQPLKSGDLVLIDAGAEYNYYAADITRTFPVSGKFSSAQREVYERVLEVQKEIIAQINPGVVKKSLQDFAIDRLTEAMRELKLLKIPKDQAIETNAYKNFYPHGFGHFLGLDVHDAGYSMINGEPRQLEAGMALTVEPGIYVPPSTEDVPAELLGLGIRIEDDIVVTEDGHEVLTSLAPKEISEIESIVGSQPLEIFN